MQENKSNILIYQTEDGVTKIETRHTKYKLNLFDTKSEDLQYLPTSERIKSFLNSSEIPNCLIRRS